MTLAAPSGTHEPVGGPLRPPPPSPGGAVAGTAPTTPPRGPGGASWRVVEATVPFLAVVALTVGTQPWWSAFTPTPAPAFAAASLAPVVLAWVAGRVLGRGPLLSLVATVLLAVAFVSLGAAGAVLGPAELGESLRDGLAELLSTTLPVARSPWLLVVPLLVAWSAATVAGESLARSRGVVVPFAAFASLHLVAYATVVDAGGVALWPSLAILACGAGMAAVRRWLATPPVALAPSMVGVAGSVEATTARPPLRPLAWGAVSAAAAVVLLAVAVPTLPPSQRSPLAAERTPPVTVDDVVTPIAVSGALRRGELGIAGDDVVYRIDGLEGPPGVEDGMRYLTVASMDRYDGATWRYLRTFEPTGGRIPVERTLTTPRSDLGVDVVTGVPATETWIPVPGRAELVEGVPVRFDPGTAMVVAAEPLEPGDSLRVHARQEPRTLGRLDLDGVIVGASARPEDDEYPAPLREDLDRWSRRIARDQEVPGSATPEFLVAMEAHLRDAYARVLHGDDDEGGTQIGGTSFAEVAASIGIDRVGTPEQFATLYALVARRVGVPARVVTGFRVVPAVEGPTELRGEDAWTWVEVPIEGHGWVVVDPTPDATQAPPPEEASGASTTTTVAERPDTAEAVADEGGSPLAPPGDLSLEEDRMRARWWVLPVLLVAVGVVVVGAAVARRAIVRRRRRRGAVGPRAVGALHEVLDGLDRAGVERLDARSTRELVGVAAGISPEAAERVGLVAHHADRAIFGSDEGVGEPAAPVAPEHATAADEAWVASQQVRRQVLAHLGWRRRARSVLRRPRRWG